jgi:DNA-binding XRE family transcriptional regulator
MAPFSHRFLSRKVKDKMDAMTDEECQMTIGMLVTEAREASGRNREDTAQRLGLASITLRRVENGDPIAKSTLMALERGFDWRQGSLTELWERRRSIPFGQVTSDYVKAPEAPAAVKPVARAAELTTAELMAELSFRFLMMEQHNSDIH